MKQLHKFYSKADVPWVQQVWFKYYSNRVPHSQKEVGSFWWKDVFRLKDLYGFITTCQLGDGTSVLLWKGNWAGEILIDLFPNIAMFVKHPDISVKEVCEAESLDNLFHIPISQAAAVELEDLRTLAHSFELSEDTDMRIFCWGSSMYSAAKLYKLAFLTMQTPADFRFIWKSKVTPRVKFFAWLILLDRLNTKNMLARRNFNVQPNSLCVLCDDGMEETIDHLFFQCRFAKQCWDKLGVSWVTEDDLSKRIERSRQMAGLPFFMEIFLIAAWELWKIRNRLVFDGIQATFSRWLRNFKEEAGLQSYRLKDSDRVLVCLWLDAL